MTLETNTAKKKMVLGKKTNPVITPRRTPAQETEATETDKTPQRVHRAKVETTRL